MKNFLVTLLMTLTSCCTLTLARPSAETTREPQLFNYKNKFYSESDEMFHSAASIPHRRVPRSLLKALNAKKSLLLRGRKKLKEVVQCCSLADTGEYIKPEIAEKIIKGLDDDQLSSLDILLKNNTGPLTLTKLLADLLKDTSELNLPEGVQLTNKAVVEALLSKNVLLKFPLTDDNGIVIADQRALVSSFNSGSLKFPLRDRFGIILRDLTDALPDGAKEVLGTLLGGNVVSDILESGVLGLLKYPIKDAKGIPVLDVGLLLSLVVLGGLKNFKFPITNAFGLELKDETDLLLILMDGGFLKNLVYPVRDSNGVVLQNKQAFLKALRQGLALKVLEYPIKDSFGITIKRPDALMAALLDDDAARAVGFPLTDAKGAVLKDKLQLFLTLVDGGLNLVTFPLKDAEGNFFKDKLAFLIAIVEALRDKQGLEGLLLRSVAAITKFPLVDKAGTTINDKTESLTALLDGQALAGLNFPYSDVEGNSIPNKEAFLKKLLNTGLDSIEFPLTNRDGRVLHNGLDVLDALIDGSALMGLKYPLSDKTGRIIKDKERLLQHIFKNDLKYPLTDCVLNEVQDFAELMSLLLDGEALENLKFPLFDAMGGIFKNKADFLGSLIKGGLEALKFPLEESGGGVLMGLENLLESLLDNSVLSQLVFPLTDVTGMVFKNKLDFLDSLLGGVLGLPNLSLADILGGAIKDVDTLLQSLLGGVKLLNFPLTDVLGSKLNNSSDLLADVVKASPGLQAITFPLSDEAGHVLMDSKALLDILPDAKALSALRFPLTDCAGRVFKNKSDFLRRLMKGLTTLNFPLKDGAGLNLPNGKSLLQVLLQAVLTLLIPVLKPLTDVLGPVTGLVKGLLSGNLTVIESLLTDKNFNSPSALRFPLSDASGRNITNQLELLENLLNGGLMALEFPITDCTGQVLSDKKDFLEQLIANGPLANLQFPLRTKEGTALGNELSLLATVSNNNLITQDFPLTDANGWTIHSKLEFLIKLFDNKALSRLNYPLTDKNINSINTKQDLLELLLDGGLASFKYPIFDAGDRVFEDKEALADILDEVFIPPPLTESQTSKPPSSVLNGILKLLGVESSLSGDDLSLFKALKTGSISERDLKDLLGDQKFSVLEDKLAKDDKDNALDDLQLTKILDGLLALLLKKKPELFTENSDENSFT